MKTHKATIRGRQVNVTVPGEEPGVAPDTIVNMRTFVAEAIEAYCEASNVSLDRLEVAEFCINCIIGGKAWSIEVYRKKR